MLRYANADAERHVRRGIRRSRHRSERITSSRRGGSRQGGRHGAALARARAVSARSTRDTVTARNTALMARPAANRTSRAPPGTRCADGPRWRTSVARGTSLVGRRTARSAGDAQPGTPAFAASHSAVSARPRSSVTWGDQRSIRRIFSMFTTRRRMLSMSRRSMCADLDLAGRPPRRCRPPAR